MYISRLGRTSLIVLVLSAKVVCVDAFFADLFCALPLIGWMFQMMGFCESESVLPPSAPSPGGTVAPAPSPVSPGTPQPITDAPVPAPVGNDSPASVPIAANPPRPGFSGETSMDDLLLEAAQSVLAIGLNSPEGQLPSSLDAFQLVFPNIKQSLRTDLQKKTMEALALASIGQVQQLLDKPAMEDSVEDSFYSAALSYWNDAGEQEITGFDGTTTTFRNNLCIILSNPGSLADNSQTGETPSSSVPADIVDCFCDNTDPYIWCQAKLGSAGLDFSRRRRQRHHRQTRQENTPRQHQTHEDNTPGLMQLRQAVNNETKGQRDLAKIDLGKCSLEILPDDPSFATNVIPSFGDIAGIISGEPTEVSVKGECCLPLQPPPLNLIELCGSVAVSATAGSFTWAN